MIVVVASLSMFGLVRDIVCDIARDMLNEFVILSGVDGSLYLDMNSYIPTYNLYTW